MSKDTLDLDSVFQKSMDVKQLSRQDKIDIIRKCRVSGTRNANAILLIATDLLAGGSSGLSTGELYDLYEQVLVSSLDCGKVENAKMYLNIIEKRFGRQSIRVRHLRGLCLEGEGKTEEAKALYKEVLEQQPTNDFVVKRMSAILKSEGKYRDAIAVLEREEVYKDEDDKPHTFMEIHRGSAASAYRELGHLYYRCGDTDKAIYYYEEAILFAPNSYFLHARLAEMFYMKKDLARCAIEYSHSLNLNQSPNNARAAYGLWQVVSEQLKQHSSGVRRLEEEKELPRTQELKEFAAELLHTMYAGSSSLAALEAVLSRA